MRPGTLLVLALLTGGCAGPGGGSAGAGSARLRVTLRDYKGENVFELVSESHTDRVEYYSTPRTDAARKIQTDEVMQALVKELSKEGFRAHSQDGRAPSRGGELITWGLEIEDGDRTAHWVVGKGSAVDDWKHFKNCSDAFLQLYNVTASFQAIQNPTGKDIFQEPRKGRT